jgi:hypothetical protein
LFAAFASATMLPVGIRKALIAAALTIAVAVPSGCGESDQSAASEAAQAYVDARNDHDYEMVCELYSEQLTRKLTGGLVTCQAFVKEQTTGSASGPLKVVSVNATDDHATAQLQTTGESGQPKQLKITLEKQNGSWVISGLG